MRRTAGGSACAMNTRFGDGYRNGGLIIGIWSDNTLGTKEDMEGKASNNPADNFIAAAYCAMAATEKNETELYAQAVVAAMQLFRLTKEQSHLDWAAQYAQVVTGLLAWLF